MTISSQSFFSSHIRHFPRFYQSQVIPGFFLQFGRIFQFLFLCFQFLLFLGQFISFLEKLSFLLSDSDVMVCILHHQQWP